MIDYLKHHFLFPFTLICMFTGAINAHADSCAQEEGFSFCALQGLELWGDFLYWKPCIEGMTYAAHIEKLPGDADGSYSQEIRFDSLHWDWTPGFRVGFALDDIWGEWRFGGSYSYLNADKEFEAFANNSFAVISPWQFGLLENPNTDPSSPFDGFSRIKGKARFCYQYWDLLIARAIETRGCHTIVPFIGAEGLMLNQNVKARSTLPANPDIQVGYTTIHWHSDFKAYGVKFGTDCIFELGQCLHFFSRGSFSIAQGKNHGKNKQFVQHTAPSQTTPIQQSITSDDHSNCHSECRWVNGYQIQLGFIYETELCGYDFGARLGYEFVKWHHVPTPSKVSQGTQDGNYQRSQLRASDYATLGFHGLMAGLSLTF